MRDVLSLAGRRALASIDRTRTLLAFDFDGTLAPIVAEPDRAVLGAMTRSLLAALAGRASCAVISGRRRGDVLARLLGVAPLDVIGNHGIEDALLPVGTNDDLLPTLYGWRETIDAHCAHLKGVWVEDKQCSLSVHYRKAPKQKLARDLIALAAAKLKGARLVPGKHVWNVVPGDGRHKGDAVRSLMAARGCDRFLYVGDDETDEDVFRLLPDVAGIGISVGRRKASCAPWFLSSQGRIDELLGALVKMLSVGESPLRAESAG